MNFCDKKNNCCYLAPSLLAADFGNLAKEVREIDSLPIDILHLDIMDGHFVPNLSFGSDVVKVLRDSNQLIFDVHLMVTKPFIYVDSFVQAGSNHITFHLEAVDNVEEGVFFIKEKGLSVGLSIRPNTPVKKVLPFLDIVDLILIMTVEPGFGGQSFIDLSDKINLLRREINLRKLATHIQVDGGINLQTIKKTQLAGANIFVTGTGFFGYPQGKSEAYKALMGKIND